jgi:hypothetical protein
MAWGAEKASAYENNAPEARGEQAAASIYAGIYDPKYSQKLAFRTPGLSRFQKKA